MWSFINLALFVAALSALVYFMVRARRISRELERRLSELELEEDHVFDFLHGIGAAFSEDVRSSELHRLIVESAVRIMDGAAGALYLANKDCTTLTPSFITPGCPTFVTIPEHIQTHAANKQASLDSFQQLQPAVSGEGLIGECWLTGKFRTATAEEFSSGKSNSAIVGPLIYRHKILGVLAVANGGESVAFSDSDLKVFRTIAEQSAFALYNEAIYLMRGKEASRSRPGDRERHSTDSPSIGSSGFRWLWLQCREHCRPACERRLF